MPQMVVVGNQYAGGNSCKAKALAVDPLSLAGRIALRPLEYAAQGQVLGHYAVAIQSGDMAYGGTSQILSRIRWTDVSRFLVLMRLRVGWAVTGALTGKGVNVDIYKLSSFSTDVSTSQTILNMSAVANTNKMRASMGTSLMGASGPAIVTDTTAGTGPAVFASPQLPEARYTWPMVVPTTGNGTNNTVPVAAAGESADVYNWTNFGQHPWVLGQFEGIGVFAGTRWPTDGTIKLYVTWEWAEVQVF